MPLLCHAGDFRMMVFGKSGPENMTSSLINRATSDYTKMGRRRTVGRDGLVGKGTRIYFFDYAG